MNQPPEVRQMSPQVRYILGGVLFLGVAIFIFSMHRKQRPEWADIKASNDNWYTQVSEPTPIPTPRILPRPVQRPIQIVPPPKPVAKPPQKVCQICIERIMRYYKAIETGMGGDFGGNVRELPQIKGQPAPTPAPNIFAYEPPPKS